MRWSQAEVGTGRELLGRLVVLEGGYSEDKMKERL